MRLRFRFSAPWLVPAVKLEVRILTHTIFRSNVFERFVFGLRYGDAWVAMLIETLCILWENNQVRERVMVDLSITYKLGPAAKV